MSGSSGSVVQRSASGSRQVSRIRAAAAEWNNRSRAAAAAGGSPHDRGSGDVVGCELDAISIPNETEESDGRRSATSTRGLGNHGGRTHHHVSKQKCGNLSRGPMIAMDYYFLKPNSTVSSQTIPGESVTCIAVQEKRHQSIMSSVALKEGIEEPWVSERVARFINSLGYKQITLKSDTEAAMIAFSNRVAETCNAEVTLEDAVKGDKLSNGLV